MDQKTDLTKPWRNIKGIDGRAKREAENETITFNGISFSSSKQLATKFNQQFNTSKLGRHISSRETRVVTRETKKKPLEIGHNLSESGYMEVIINHLYTEVWQGNLPRNFLPANLVTLPSGKSPGISALTHNQQKSPTYSRPTRFQT